MSNIVRISVNGNNVAMLHSWTSQPWIEQLDMLYHALHPNEANRAIFVTDAQGYVTLMKVRDGTGQYFVTMRTIETETKLPSGCRHWISQPALFGRPVVIVDEYSVRLGIESCEVVFGELEEALS